MKMTDEVAILRRTGADVGFSTPAAAAWPAPSGSNTKNSQSPRPSANAFSCPPSAAATPETILVADGFSCREQISQNTARRALHFAEVIAP